LLWGGFSFLGDRFYILEVVMRRAFVLFWFGLAAQSQAQTQSPDSAVMQALLSEVHQLRLALERANTFGPRIQLLVERMKLQQDHVTRISSQLEGVRHELEKAQSDGARLAETLKNVESDVAQSTDPAERKHLGDQIRDLKSMVEQEQRLEQGARSQEADLNSRLQSEQATLDGLNDRLNQIERALDATPNK